MKFILKSVLVLAVFLLFDIPTISNATDCSTASNGTTENLKEIVIGRCHEFFKINNCNFDKSLFNCEKIWEKFSIPIIGKEPCSIKITDFNDFILEVDHQIPVNKSLFWSGTYALAQESMEVQHS